MGYGIDEYKMSDSPYRGYQVVDLPLYYDGDDLNSTFASFYETIAKYKNQCNIIFNMPGTGDHAFVGEPSHYVKWAVLEKYRKARQSNPMALVYNPREFNIAFVITCTLYSS